MLFTTVLSLAALISSAAAVLITAPTNTSGWETSGSEEITWSTVATDPTTFDIQLITPQDPNTPINITSNVDSSSGQYTYTPPSDLAVGGNYRVNIVSPNGGILAQSDYFNVTQGTSSVSPSSSAPSSTASTSGTSSGTTTSTSATSSTPASSSPSASASGAAGQLVTPGGALMFLAAAIGVLA
ncbi:hypothetical protein M231_04201 [Tremella mesenterica]|uniref:Yeast cell wall synthesis Kre9/Knh1-like N-terminal domain-containing protein n=1 Tax=Tremella mesenterica TaxID=5217 RepID=A0A4Q1BLA9_TREME|nr:uncharacterized protein TREMEDRAFT_73107 [Tremella mesenterica DSM 1558]EIW73595.1 hypothetical protein TREMEDRAFT_73107 [Tremella mesenterica DSM 1558]RXK38568.1 hypothetical protein M231_04201 [Tremella mesenterica]